MSYERMKTLLDLAEQQGREIKTIKEFCEFSKEIVAKINKKGNKNGRN